jgi:hypothetical protein
VAKLPWRYTGPALESAREMSLIGIAKHEGYFGCRMFTSQH